MNMRSTLWTQRIFISSKLITTITWPAGCIAALRGLLSRRQPSGRLITSLPRGEIQLAEPTRQGESLLRAETALPEELSTPITPAPSLQIPRSALALTLWLHQQAASGQDCVPPEPAPFNSHPIRRRSQLRNPLSPPL